MSLAGINEKTRASNIPSARKNSVIVIINQSDLKIYSRGIIKNNIRIKSVSM